MLVFEDTPLHTREFNVTTDGLGDDNNATKATYNLDLSIHHTHLDDLNLDVWPRFYHG